MNPPLLGKITGSESYIENTQENWERKIILTDKEKKSINQLNSCDINN